MTQIDDTTTIDATVERYLAFWNAGPGPEQQQLATAVFREDVDHRGPFGARAGVDRMLQLSRDFAEHLGDVTFRARTEPVAHDRRVRLQWEVLRSGESFAEGTDVLALREHRLIESVITFLDREPEGFDPHAH